MSRRHKPTDFEKGLNLLATLPWQICLFLAVIAGVAFHWLSLIEPLAPQGSANMLAVIAGGALKTASRFLQYVAPMVLAMTGLVSWLHQRRRVSLLAQRA